jgi:hypothetical protein
LATVITPAGTLNLGSIGGQTIRITAELLRKSVGVVVDFMQVTTDTGWEINGYSSRQSDSSQVVGLPYIPNNVATMDITWLVQKTRSVGFLVKPPKAE